ncbi:MAG TPA: hypothetical protein VK142_01060 [Bacillota bacterium]|nr:hypothetical protein [Bacillota bacterium]
MGEYGNMNGDFFAIVWLVVFLVIIITSILLVQMKKKKTRKRLEMLQKQFNAGELNEIEYETKKKKILRQ